MPTGQTSAFCAKDRIRHGRYFSNSYNLIGWCVNLRLTFGALFDLTVPSVAAASYAARDIDYRGGDIIETVG